MKLRITVMSRDVVFYFSFLLTILRIASDIRSYVSYSCTSTMPTPYQHYRLIPLRWEMLLLYLLLYYYSHCFFFFFFLFFQYTYCIGCSSSGTATTHFSFFCTVTVTVTVRSAHFSFFLLLFLRYYSIIIPLVSSSSSSSPAAPSSPCCSPIHHISVVATAVATAAVFQYTYRRQSGTTMTVTAMA